MSLFSLDGKVAVVTGALGLLGRHHCTALADAGAHVVAGDLDGEACWTFARQLGSDSIGVSMDVTQPDSIQAALDLILLEFGHVDVLVNNAAVNDMFESPSLALEQSRFESYPLAQWKRMMEVNVTGIFLCSQMLGAQMARQGGGSIVNIASTYGLVGPDQSLYRGPDGRQVFFKSPAYPTGKGAVLAFTRYLAAYWGRSAVRVNALCPGGVENGQEKFFVGQYAARTPLGRMAQPTDYQGALVFLASDASSYVTGAHLVVDGGWTAW
jgi:NAD(P)-dependent dehydrogenase (short-subunit alcohol dehydrogenase family)